MAISNRGRVLFVWRGVAVAAPFNWHGSASSPDVTVDNPNPFPSTPTSCQTPAAHRTISKKSLQIFDADPYLGGATLRPDWSHYNGWTAHGRVWHAMNEANFRLKDPWLLPTAGSAGCSCGGPDKPTDNRQHCSVLQHEQLHPIFKSTCMSQMSMIW